MQIITSAPRTVSHIAQYSILLPCLSTGRSILSQYFSLMAVKINSKMCHIRAISEY